MLKQTLRPQLTAYECMLLICCSLVLKGKTILRQDNLVPILYRFQSTEQAKILFDDVAFKKNIDTVTSIDIEDSLCKLQTFGAIGKLNPAYEKIVIYICPEEAKRFLSDYNGAYRDAAFAISEAF